MNEEEIARLIAIYDGRVPLDAIPEASRPRFEPRAFGGVKKGWRNNGDGTVSRIVLREMLFLPKD